MNDEVTPPASSSSQAAPAALVSSKTLKLPPFWPNDPILWFAQVEAQFTTRNITSQARKFAYIISTLQPEITQEIRDILINPPAENLYDTLKTELIKCTSASEKNRLHQLLNSEELGDRKPSQLLRKMRQLLGDTQLEDGILLQLFLQRLPMNAQIILSTTSDTVTVDQVALIADKILEVATPSAISAVQSTVHPATPQKTDELADLHSQVNKLTSQVEALVN